MRKSETPFNLRRNNHRSDLLDKNLILASRHFSQDKFTLIKIITNTNKLKEAIQPNRLTH